MSVKVVGLSLGMMLLASAAVAAAAEETGPARPDAPHGLAVLRDNCFACHNPEKKKGGLVLTTRAAALAGGENGPALVPGKTDESPLVQLLAAAADPHMPPKKQLPPADVAAVRAWVEAGARWDEAVLAARPAATRPVELRGLPATYRPVLALSLAPGDGRLAAGRGNRIVIHDLTKSDRPVERVLDGPRDVVQCLAWSPDGKRLAAGEYERVLVWEVGSTDPPTELKGLTGRVTAVQFLASSDTLIVADGGTGTPGRLHRFDLPKPEPRASVTAHADSVLSLALARDGALLASGGADRTVAMWDPATLKEVARLEGHGGHVLSVAFKPDGSRLASGATDRDVKVWDVKAREQKITIGPHPAAVTAVAWAGDGKRVIAACEDGTARADSPDEKQPGRPFPAVGDVVYALAVTADGKATYAGCHDGHVYVWGEGGKPPVKLPDAPP